MSKQSPGNPLPHFETIAIAAAHSPTPTAFFRALEQGIDAVIGHKLFTVLLLHGDTGETERFYTSHPGEYPVGGRKPPNPSPWATHLLVDQEPYIGDDGDDIRANFFDHELIASLGCESVLNIPVVHEGRTLGTINLLHEANWYDEGDIPLGRIFAALAIPPYSKLSDGLGEG